MSEVSLLAAWLPWGSTAAILPVLWLDCCKGWLVGIFLLAVWHAGQTRCICIHCLDFQCLACSAELLTAIRAHVPPPPDAVLAHFDLDALLDSTASAIPGSMPSTASSETAVPHQQALLRPLSGKNTKAAASAAAEAPSAVLDTEALAEAVRQDPDVSLHAELYHMLAQCEPDVFEHLSADELIQQQGHEQIVGYLQLTRSDLCYHPWRYESWERVLSESFLCFLPRLLF